MRLFTHLCRSKYYTKEQDGLAQSWAGETVFCNPPYSRKTKSNAGQIAWVEKCYKEAQGGIIVVMLISAHGSNVKPNSLLSASKRSCGVPQSSLPVLKCTLSIFCLLVFQFLFNIRIFWINKEKGLGYGIAEDWKAGKIQVYRFGTSKMQNVKKSIIAS